tara:strand:- start:1876 stop:2112 length:237 start_codon:yes stop_codon:yes gene_type:complete
MASPIEIDLPNIRIPRPKEWPALIAKKLKEYHRVMGVTRKPSMTEFQAVAKVTGLGMLVIGLIGFSIFMVVQVLEKLA